MTIMAGALLPHAPVLVPEIGQQETISCQATVAGMTQTVKAVLAKNPGTIIIISPHGSLNGPISVNQSPFLEADLADFKHPEISYLGRNHTALAQQLVAIDGFAAINGRLNYSQMVPLYFLQKQNYQGKIVPITTGQGEPDFFYQMGQILGQVLQAAAEKIAIIVSGDLSHCLGPQAPMAYNPAGAAFDRSVAESIQNWQPEPLLKLSVQERSAAAQCGLIPLLVGWGCFNGLDVKPQVFSYQAPYGVGYLAAAWPVQVASAHEPSSVMPQTATPKETTATTAKPETSIPVRLALAAIKSFLLAGQHLPTPDWAMPLLAQPQAAFVCLKKQGQLRGCIGTIEPVSPNAAMEIIGNAISAAIHDPRFAPVGASELAELTCEVDLLNPPQKVSDLSRLNPQTDGIIVTAKGKRGLLLPNLAGIETVEQQIAVAKAKAGIADDAKFILESFTVTRYY